MGNYKIVFAATAKKQITKLPKKIIVKILATISGLSFDPYPVGSKKMSGYSNIYRIRIQNYRVIYEVLENEIIIKVLKIGHRKDIYRK